MDRTLSRIEHSAILLRQYCFDLMGRPVRSQRDRLSDEQWRLVSLVDSRKRSIIASMIGHDALSVLEDFIQGVTVHSFTKGVLIVKNLQNKIAAVRFENYLHFRNWNEDFLIQWREQDGNGAGYWQTPLTPGMEESNDGTWWHPREGISVWLEDGHSGAIVPVDSANERLPESRNFQVKGTNWDGLDGEAAHRVVTVKLDDREEIAAYVRLIRSDLDVTVADAIRISHDPRHASYATLLPSFQDFLLDSRRLPESVLRLRLTEMAEMGRYNMVAETAGRIRHHLMRQLRDACCPKGSLSILVSSFMKGFSQYLHALLMHFGPHEVRWRETGIVNGNPLLGILTFTVHNLTQMLRQYGIPLVLLTDTQALSEVGRRGPLGGMQGYFTHQNGRADGLVECNLIPRKAVPIVEANLVITDRQFCALQNPMSRVRRAQKSAVGQFRYGASIVGGNTKHLLRDLLAYRQCTSPTEKTARGWRLYIKYSYDLVEQLLPYQSLQQRMVEAVEETAVRLGRSPQDLTILNAGSGPGPFEALLLDRYSVRMPQVISFDYDREVVRIAQERINKKTTSLGAKENDFSLGWRFQSLQADIRRIPVREASVDLAIATNVLYILRPDMTADAISDLWRCVKPGGMLRFSMPFYTFANAPIQREHFQRAGFVYTGCRMVASAGKVAIMKAFNRDTIQGDIVRGKNVGLRLFGTNGDCHRNASPEEIHSALINHSVREELTTRAMGPMHHSMTEKERSSIQSAMRQSGYLLDEEAMITGGVGSLSVWVNFSEEIRRKIGRENHQIALEPTYANQFMILSILK